MCLTLELEMDIILPPPAFTENSAASGVLSLELWEAPWCFAFLAQVTFIGELLYLAFCSQIFTEESHPGLSSSVQITCAPASAYNRIMSIDHWKKRL